MKENNLEFRISSGLKDIIGKDLITDDFIAVFELVKNSYDAHAQNVTITFEEDKIIIADDGKGMSLEDLEKKWLFVAYSAKKDGSEDNEFDSNNKRESYRDTIQTKRHYAGSKGIGRFSSDRLGSQLRLTTQKQDSDQYDQLVIDWNSFNNQNQEFKTIEVGHISNRNYHISFPNISKHGTILEISNIKTWDRAKKLKLKHSLEKLINPFEESNDFKIYIVSNHERKEDINGFYRTNKEGKKGQRYSDRDKVNGQVKNAILDILELKTTQISVSIKDGNIQTQLIDRGDHIYHIKEKNEQFQHIDDAKIDLFFLNRSAKLNFKKEMGLEPVNFGSVFLFKNGFRVQPFGDKGNDSWGLDYRSQQGYNRFLGTRDLFGRVEILTNNTVQFKEVSSRDGGLVQTAGYRELMEFFELTHRRLERYVAGVLWGEAFKRKKYFGNGEDAITKADEFRESLSDDKDSDNNGSIKTNLGSKIDFIQLIKSLTNNDKVEIIRFNTELVDLVNDKLVDLQPKFITDLEKIANKTEDKDLKLNVLKAEQKYEQLKKEKQDAERKILEEAEKRKIADEARIRAEKKQKEEEEARIRAEKKQKEEEEARIRAEKKQKEDEEARIRAEKKQKEEEEARIKAENEALKKEKQRILAELAKLKAEKKAEEEKVKRENTEKDIKHQKDKNTYLLATRNINEEAEEFSHSIKLRSLAINESVNKLLERITVLDSIDVVLSDEVTKIHTLNSNIIQLTKLITKSNFKADEIKRKVNISKYIEQYLDVYKIGYEEQMNIKLEGKSEFVTRVSLLDLSSVIDNLVSNSKKAKAQNVIIKIQDKNDTLEIIFSDDGNGLADEFIHSPNSIFELGVKSWGEGSGIGLHSVKKRMKDMYGAIEFMGNNTFLKGATFKIIFN